MSCAHCIAKVRQAAESAGATRCEVDVAAGQATVAFEAASSSISRIVQSISGAGYGVVGFRKMDGASSHPS